MFCTFKLNIMTTCTFLYVQYLTGGKWNKNSLTYFIYNYTEKLERIETDKEIARAFKEWSDVVPLEFTQIYKQVSIIHTILESIV